MRIFLIEDDITTAKNIQRCLNNNGFICDTTNLGEDGLEIGKMYEYDIIILDLQLPDMDGFEVLQKLRLSQIQTPILVLSGLSHVENKIKVLGFGADDYLTKPFNSDELIARIHAVVRRFRGYSESIIKVGKLSIDLKNKVAYAENVPINLTSKEYSILELLSLRKGSTLTKETFLNHLYGGIDEPELKIIDVFICKLRKKITEALGDDRYIETVWGRGYVLRSPQDDSYPIGISTDIM